MNRLYRITYPHRRLISNHGMPKRYAEQPEEMVETILAPDEQTARNRFWQRWGVNPYSCVLMEDWRKKQKK